MNLPRKKIAMGMGAMPGGAMPNGRPIVQQMPALRGNMSAPAPSPAPGAAATAGGVQQMMQQKQVIQQPGGPMMPPPVKMASGQALGPGQPTPPAPPPQSPTQWVGNPLAPSGQGPVTSQVPPINAQPPMFRQNPMQKASMADAAKVLMAAGFVKKAGPLDTAGLFGAVGATFGAGDAGPGRRMRGAMSGGIRGLATGAGTTLGGVAGDEIAKRIMQSDMGNMTGNYSPGTKILSLASILGGRALGGYAGYKATSGVPGMFGFGDSEEEEGKYAGFGCHTLDGPMVGSPEPRPQPKVVTTDVQSKKVDPSELFKQGAQSCVGESGMRMAPSDSVQYGKDVDLSKYARTKGVDPKLPPRGRSDHLFKSGSLIKVALPGVGKAWGVLGNIFGAAKNTGVMDDVARVGQRFTQRAGQTLNPQQAAERFNRVSGYMKERMARGPGGAAAPQPGTGLVPSVPPPLPPGASQAMGQAGGGALQSAGQAITRQPRGMLENAWRAVRKPFVGAWSKIPQPIRSPLGGYLMGSGAGEGIDAATGAMGYDTNFSTYLGGLGAASRFSPIRRALGNNPIANQTRNFFTGGAHAAKQLGTTGNRINKGLMYGSIGIPAAAGIGSAAANHYVNGKIEDFAQQAGFGSGDEMMSLAKNFNSGNLLPVIQHAWGRLSPQQQMAMIGGGGSLLAGALGGATGMTGGATTAGLMGAGALGLGLGTGFIPGLQQGRPQQQAPAPYQPPQPQQTASVTGPGMDAKSMYQPRNEFALQAHLA